MHPLSKSRWAGLLVAALAAVCGSACGALQAMDITAGSGSSSAIPTLLSPSPTAIPTSLSPLPTAIPAPLSPSATAIPTRLNTRFPVVTTNGIHQTPHPDATPSTSACGAHALSASSDQRGYPTPDTITDWQFVTEFRLTNESSSTCTLTGWVDFTMVGEDYICAAPPPGYPQTCIPPDHAAHRDQKVSRLDLDAPKVYFVRPGEHVSFSVLWNPIIGPDCPHPWIDFYAVELRVPGDQTAILLRKPIGIQPCSGEVAITALGISI